MIQALHSSDHYFTCHKWRCRQAEGNMAVWLQVGELPRGERMPFPPSQCLRHSRTHMPRLLG